MKMHLMMAAVVVMALAGPALLLGQTKVVTADELRTATEGQPIALGQVDSVDAVGDVTVGGSLIGDNRLPLGGASYGTDDGLVTWYRMDGDVLDSVGTNSVAWTNAEAYVDGKRWKAASFDGTNYLSGAVIPEVASNLSWTVGMWVWIGSSTHRARVWSNIRGSSDRIGIEFRDGTVRAALYNASGYYGLKSAPLVTGWNHIVWTWDGSTGRLFNNGVESLSIGTPTLSVAVGFELSTSSGSFMLIGRVDEFRAYSRVLTPAEITGLYEADRDWFKSSVSGDLDVVGHLRSTTAQVDDWQYWGEPNNAESWRMGRSTTNMLLQVWDAATTNYVTSQTWSAP